MREVERPLWHIVRGPLVLTRRRDNNRYHALWRDECEAVVYTAVAWRGNPEEYTDELIEAVDALTDAELKKGS